MEDFHFAFFQKGIPIVTRAIQEDNGRNYEEAFHLYQHAIEWFRTAVRCT